MRFHRQRILVTTTWFMFCPTGIQSGSLYIVLFCYMLDFDRDMLKQQFWFRTLRQFCFEVLSWELFVNWPDLDFTEPRYSICETSLLHSQLLGICILICLFYSGLRLPSEIFINSWWSIMVLKKEKIRERLASDLTNPNHPPPPQSPNFLSPRTIFLSKKNPSP